MWRDDAALNNFQWYWFCGFWSRRPCCDRCCPPNFTGKPLSYFHLLFVCTSDWLLLCLPHLYIREPWDLYTCELNYFYLNIIQFELMNFLWNWFNMQNAHAQLIHELSTFVYIAVSREDLMAVSPHSLSLSSHACQGYQPVCCIQVCTPLLLFL